MTIAHKKNRSSFISPKIKLKIAIDSLSNNKTITDVSNENQCSRTTVYNQKNKLLDAADLAFIKADEKDILFNFPIKKSTIHMIVLALFLICKSSYRDIQIFLKTIFDFKLSLGGVFNIIDVASNKAVKINNFKLCKRYILSVFYYNMLTLH